MCGCPFCGGNFEDAVRCSACGEWFLSYELESGVCDCCAEEKAFEYRYDFNSCFELAKSASKSSVALNAFLWSIFSEDQIEQILLKELFNRSAFKQINCSAFINADRGWFLEHILKLEKEKEK
jgi:hypothetical protein